MGKDSDIQWTHHTFNPWWGCVRVSPGCENCYAETFDKRLGRADWGVKAPRRFFGDKHWNEPLKWDRAAAAAGERHRVFCASMADVFEDRLDLRGERERLWKLIRSTPNLDWLLLTKRPENLGKMLPWTVGAGFHATCELDVCKAALVDGIGCPHDSCDIDDGVRACDPWPNVWIGTTVEDDTRAQVRIPILRAIPAVVRFLSMEPLLQYPKDIDLSGIHWAIIGGESGPKARQFRMAWVYQFLRDCKKAKTSPFVKQLGANVIDSNDGRFAPCEWDDGENLAAWPPSITERDGAIEDDPNGFREEYQGAPVRVRLHDGHGGDMEEWPRAARVREFPEVHRG